MDRSVSNITIDGPNVTFLFLPARNLVLFSTHPTPCKCAANKVSGLPVEIQSVLVIRRQFGLLHSRCIAAQFLAACCRQNAAICLHFHFLFARYSGNFEPCLALGSLLFVVPRWPKASCASQIWVARSTKAKVLVCVNIVLRPASHTFPRSSAANGCRFPFSEHCYVL